MFSIRVGTNQFGTVEFKIFSVCVLDSIWLSRTSSGLGVFWTESHILDEGSSSISSFLFGIFSDESLSSTGMLSAASFSIAVLMTASLFSVGVLTESSTGKSVFWRFSSSVATLSLCVVISGDRALSLASWFTNSGLGFSKWYFGPKW